jgi:hypothetical protein
MLEHGGTLVRALYPMDGNLVAEVRPSEPADLVALGVSPEAGVGRGNATVVAALEEVAPGLFVVVDLMRLKGKWSDTPPPDLTRPRHCVTI